MHTRFLMEQSSHHNYMEQAIELAQQGMEAGEGGPFGAVIVRDGKIIGSGCNRVLSLSDPTAHGEVTAIRDAGKRTCNPWLEGATLYTSCEPCPMCITSAMWAHIEKIFYAATREDAADIGFDDSNFYNALQMTVDTNVIPVEHMADLRQRAQQIMMPWKERADHY